MPEAWAKDFLSIQRTLAERVDLRDRMLRLVAGEKIHGRNVEGPGRAEALREVLAALVRGETGLDEAAAETLRRLPRAASRHAKDNRVFPAGWEARLVRTQLSRFYSQAALEELRERGYARCFVPPSAAEPPDTECSRRLAGAHHDVAALHRRLVAAYALGRSGGGPKVPQHPRCTHVVHPPVDGVGAILPPPG